MYLPACFKLVNYRVAGSVTYLGDLVITENVIYYFPRAELAGLFYTVGYLGWAIFWGILGSMMMIFAPETAKTMVKEELKKRLVKPYTPQGKFEREEEARFESWLTELENSYPRPTFDPQYLYPLILYPALWYPLILDALIEGTESVLAESLPKPVRLAGSAIKRIRLTAMGTLVIDAEFDMNHQFRLGLIRKRRARKALMEGAYLD